MKRYVLLGVALFLGFALSFAPAGLLSRLLAPMTNVDLIDTRGTIWRGQGQLLVNEIPLGMIDWDFQFLALLRGMVNYTWTLRAPSWHLDGTAGADFTNLYIAFDGELPASAVNERLRDYDINMTGNFAVALAGLTISQQSNTLSHLDGQVTWSGGDVRYILSGILRETTLPGLTAYLQNDDAGLAQATVYAIDTDTPLLIATQGSAGFIKIGITKLFTKLLKNPWPGRDPDHAIVLEVEEKLF